MTEPEGRNEIDPEGREEVDPEGREPIDPEGRAEIDVLYFAWMRERIGLSRERLATRAATVTDLVAELAAREPRYAAAFADTRALRVALDQELAEFDSSLAGVREVAFFPPMTGG